jgi:hypothetical protein
MIGKHILHRALGIMERRDARVAPRTLGARQPNEHRGNGHQRRSHKHTHTLTRRSHRDERSIGEYGDRCKVTHPTV